MHTAARLLLLLLLVLPAGRESAGVGETSPFMVAVLRRDGTVIPFAAFDGKNWKAPWPQNVHFLWSVRPPRASGELPINLESVPREWWGKGGPLSEMTAWLNGVRHGVITLARPTMLRLMCATPMGILSDYKSDELVPPATVQPYPKDGIALSGDQHAAAIEILSPSAPDWTPTAAAIASDFDEAEERSVRAFTDWTHPVKRVQRRLVPLELEAVYRAPMDDQGWTAYYVEAVKHYPPAPDDRGCGLMTSASGWVSAGPDGKRSVRLHARVTYCDREGVTYMLPLGLLKVDGHNFWVYQLSGYGHEGYVIARPRPKQVTMEVQYIAGDCPSF